MLASADGALQLMATRLRLRRTREAMPPRPPVGSPDETCRLAGALTRSRRSGELRWCKNGGMTTDVHRPQRRSLAFAELSEIMPDVHRMRRGHSTTGNWSLAQICRHLADSFTGSMDGFGVRNHRLMRFLFGRRAVEDVFIHGLGTGFTVAEKLKPPSNLVLDETVGELGRSIDRYRAHTGPLHFHPFFGRLTPDQWSRLHCIHCAHHLSYVVADL